MTVNTAVCRLCTSERDSRGMCPHCDDVCGRTSSGCVRCKTAARSEGVGPGSRPFREGRR